MASSEHTTNLSTAYELYSAGNCLDEIMYQLHCAAMALRWAATGEEVDENCTAAFTALADLFDLRLDALSARHGELMEKLAAFRVECGHTGDVSPAELMRRSAMLHSGCSGNCAA